MLESWYSHTVIYWLAVGWIVLLTVGAVVIISMRCRQPHSRRIAVLPIFIFLIVGAYFAFMMIDYRSWKWVFGDYTPFLCVSVIAILESCIQSGMIPSNTGYEELFRSSPVGMLILDDELNICYKTAQAEDIPRPDLIAAAEGKTQYGRNMVLQKYPLRAGYAVWEEDVTELADIIEDLENNRREIAEGNYLAEHSYRTVSRLRHTQEQNRLYDTLQKQTASQNRKMHELLRRYDSPASESERRKVLAESAVIAAYIKRKGKKAVHLGGGVQLLFGILGKRWVEDYPKISPWHYLPGKDIDIDYTPLFNEHWCYPLPEDTPNNTKAVEGACYWK
jgi:hypothetical protein